MQTGHELLDFVESKMSMSSYYQPLIIGLLAEHGGRLSADKLAEHLLLADQFQVQKTRRTLMRWPKSTLSSHGVVHYDKETRDFVLLPKFESNEERQRLIEMCVAAVKEWDRKESPKVASRFFDVIQSAKGRCEACGVPARIRPLDVDHIIPRARARHGKVKLPSGEIVPLDDRRNLQALCSK